MILDNLPYWPFPGRFDEVVDTGGALRPTWRSVEQAIGPLSLEELHARRRLADRMLDAEGAGYLVHDLALEDRTDREGHDVTRRVRSHPWRLDPLPFVIDAVEFDHLVAGVEQRMRLLEAMLGDFHGERRVLRAGVIPPAVLAGSPKFRLGACLAPQPTRWLAACAVDVARDASGTWGVVQDRTEAASGLGYTLMARHVIARASGAALRTARVAPLSGFRTAMRRALTAAAPPGRRSPRCVVLTGGPAHSTYVEHSYLAAHLGYHLVEAGDVVMRGGQLWLRAIHGLEPLDVVYRRLDDDLLDPLEPLSAGPGGVPGLAWGAWRGGVAVANAYGAGVVEEPRLRHHFAAAAEHLLGERLRLPMLDPLAPLAGTPVLGPDPYGGLESASAVVRLLAVAGPDGVEVLRGGSARMLAPWDPHGAPSARVVQDIWVVGGVAGLPVAVRQAAPPQVDLSASVSKRAADALYWLGRAAERAEVAARAARVVGAQLDQDPAPALTAESAMSWALIAVLHASQGATSAPATGGGVDGEVQRSSIVVAEQVAALVTEAMSVREYLSTMTGRLLGRLMRARADLMSEGSAEHLDSMLVDLAALSGLATESLVRGPAWRFLDLGRRVARATLLLDGIGAALTAVLDPVQFAALCNIELAINESLVAYRRRYRSDVDLGTVFDILVSDDTNPRSLVFQIDRIREHVAGLAWSEGMKIVDQIGSAALDDIDLLDRHQRRGAIADFVAKERALIDDLANSIVAHWFADPVDPRRVRGQ
jgi:uncharacterized circularly permuted ATP-grasp superfamily protein/uncharacterized alpha-E superfamily protein